MMILDSGLLFWGTLYSLNFFWRSADDHRPTVVRVLTTRGFMCLRRMTKIYWPRRVRPTPWRSKQEAPNRLQADELYADDRTATLCLCAHNVQGGPKKYETTE